MASVSGPSVPRHPSPFRKPQKVSRSSASHSTPTSSSSSSDPYHGNEHVAKLSARFVSHLFACPDAPLPVSAASTPTPRLDHFIAYALHRTRLHTAVTFASLYLLQRLKARFPAAKGSSGHRLFISAFMIASKIICDDTYSNKSWCIVGQGMFALREINQMEREMCSYLEWQLNVEPSILRDFEVQVRRDFAGSGPYPQIILPQPSPSTFPHSIPTTSTSTSIPMFGPRTSPPKPAQPAISSHSISYPPTPETPASSHSTSTSPASSISPQTPQDPQVGDFVKVLSGSASSSNMDLAGDAIMMPPVTTHSIPLPSASKPSSKPSSPESIRSVHVSPASSTHHPKSKAGRDMFAYATRTVW